MRRTKFIVGSLLGAVAIQVAVTACGVALRPDAGDASLLNDVHEHADEGVLDALADTARDVAADVLDATTDAHADDGGGSCGCPAAARTTFTGVAIRSGVSGILPSVETAYVFPSHFVRAGTVRLRWSIILTFHYLQGQSARIDCSWNSAADGSDSQYDMRAGNAQSCSMFVQPDDETTAGTVQQRITTTTPTITSLSGTGARISLPAFAAGEFAFTNGVMTVSQPDGTFAATPRAYTP